MEEEEDVENVNMVDEASQQPVSIGDAFKILVQNATEEFGFAPRDVYSGVFTLPRTREAHNAAVRTLRNEGLKAIVCAFEWGGSFPTEFSHHIVEVYPRPPPTNDTLEDEGWTIDFKSVPIARKVAVLMQTEDDKRLQQTYDLYPGTLVRSPSAGWLFRTNAHRALTHG